METATESCPTRYLSISIRRQQLCNPESGEAVGPRAGLLECDVGRTWHNKKHPSPWPLGFEARLCVWGLYADTVEWNSGLLMQCKRLCVQSRHGSKEYEGSTKIWLRGSTLPSTSTAPETIASITENKQAGLPLAPVHGTGELPRRPLASGLAVRPVYACSRRKRHTISLSSNKLWAAKFAFCRLWENVDKVLRQVVVVPSVVQ